MSQCLTKIEHECGANNALQIFSRDDGNVDGYCFSCATYVRHPYGDERDVESFPKPRVKTKEEIEADMAFISGLPQVDILDKKLRKETLEHFGVRVGLSEEDGRTPNILYYPYTGGDGEVIGWKCKIFPAKKIWSIGDLKNVQFFGWEQAISLGAKKVYITEGEDDALSLHRCLDMHTKQQFKGFSAVVSLPHGVSDAAGFMSSHWKELKENFTEIILCFDTDAPGKKAVKDVSLVCPGVLTVTVPGKDANECVVQGKTKALFNSLFKAALPKNSRVVDLSSLADKVIEPPKYGELSWPWASLNKLTRGIHLGDTIYVGAGVKMGKSGFVNAVASHFNEVDGVPVLLAKPEEGNEDTARLLAGQINGEVYNDPEVEFNPDNLYRTVLGMQGKAFALDLYQHVGWDTLKEDIRFSVLEYGVKAVFIDPITNLIAGMDPSSVNTKLGEISTEIAALALDLNFVALMFCHLNAHDGHLSPEKRQGYYNKGKFIGLGNCSHEMGGTIYSNQFAGSRAMMRSCHLMIGIEGNHDPDLENEQVMNTKHLKVLEHRRYGSRATIPLYWDPKTHLFKEC